MFILASWIQPLDSSHRLSRLQYGSALIINFHRFAACTISILETNVGVNPIPLVASGRLCDTLREVRGIQLKVNRFSVTDKRDAAMSTTGHANTLTCADFYASIGGGGIMFSARLSVGPSVVHPLTSINVTRSLYLLERFQWNLPRERVLLKRFSRSKVKGQGHDQTN